MHGDKKILRTKTAAVIVTMQTLHELNIMNCSVFIFVEAIVYCKARVPPTMSRLCLKFKVLSRREGTRYYVYNHCYASETKHDNNNYNTLSLIATENFPDEKLITTEQN